MCYFTGIMEYFHWTALLFLAATSVVLILFLWKKTLRLKNQLDGEIREKQEILSIVSHDVRSPFNRISALEQLILLDENKLSNAQKDLLDKIHVVVADGLGLVRNLVDYRNLEYRRIDIYPEPIDLSNLVHTSVKRHRSLAEKKQLTLQTNIEENVQIHSDNQLICRAIDNMLSNAIKFSPPEKIITVGLKHDNGYPHIEIKDEGPGFLPNEKDKLFRKFQKLSAKPTAGESTTGLGLFVSKAMLERIGGTIRCITAEGAGSTFVIRLPPLPG